MYVLIRQTIEAKGLDMVDHFIFPMRMAVNTVGKMPRPETETAKARKKDPLRKEATKGAHDDGAGAFEEDFKQEQWYDESSTLFRGVQHDSRWNRQLGDPANMMFKRPPGYEQILAGYEQTKLRRTEAKAIREDGRWSTFSGRRQREKSQRRSRSVGASSHGAWTSDEFDTDAYTDDDDDGDNADLLEYLSNLCSDMSISLRDIYDTVREDQAPIAGSKLSKETKGQGSWIERTRAKYHFEVGGGREGSPA